MLKYNFSRLHPLTATPSYDAKLVAQRIKEMMTRKFLPLFRNCLLRNACLCRGSVLVSNGFRLSTAL